MTALWLSPETSVRDDGGPGFAVAVNVSCTPATAASRAVRNWLRVPATVPSVQVVEVKPLASVTDEATAVLPFAGTQLTVAPDRTLPYASRTSTDTGSGKTAPTIAVW